MAMVIKVKAKLGSGIFNTKKRKDAFSAATERIANVALRDVVRTIMISRITDTGEFINSVNVVPVGKLNHAVVAVERANRFEDGYKGKEPFTPELMYWAIKRVEQGMRNPKIIDNLIKTGYLNVNYQKSKAYKIFTRAREHADKVAKDAAEFEIQKIC